MKTLYASDLDGTLLDPSAHLSDETARILRGLTERGALITFVTARTPATIEPILSAAHPRLPGVAMTGATIWNPSRRAYDYVAYHTPGDAQLIIEICRRHGITPFIYTLPRGDNGLVVYHEATRLTPLEQHFVDDRTLNDLKRFYLHESLPIGSREDIVLFFAMGDPERICHAAGEITARTDCYASWYPDTYNPGVSLLEVFTEGVSKAHGIEMLRSITEADRVVAFGDNLNDIPMLKAADVAVAVENAHPEVKEAADIIIGPNSDSSVARFIEQDYQSLRNSVEIHT